jgi:hypothetical protein
MPHLAHMLFAGVTTLLLIGMVLLMVSASYHGCGNRVLTAVNTDTITTSAYHAHSQICTLLCTLCCALRHGCCSLAVVRMYLT